MSTKLAKVNGNMEGPNSSLARDMNDNPECFKSKTPAPMLGERPRSHTADIASLIAPKSQTNRVSFQRTFKVLYLGHLVLNKRYSQPMLPWIIAEIRLHGAAKGCEIYLEVKETSIKATDAQDNKRVFEHPLQCISKFAQIAQDHGCFSYLTKELPDGPFTCHVFEAPEENAVLELFTTMREMTKELVQSHGIVAPLSRQSSGLALDTALCNSQQYEVLYVGKIKVSHKRAPPTFIDEAVEKFKAFELEKLKVQQEGRQRHDSGASVASLPHSLDLVEKAKENALSNQVSSANSSNNNSRETFSSSSDQSSFENVLKSSEESLSKSDGIDGAEPFVRSPVTAAEQFAQILNAENSSITSTQCVESSDPNTLIHDLKELINLNSPTKPESHPHSIANSLITHTQSLDAQARNVIVQDLQECVISRGRVRSCSGDVPRPSKQTSLPAFRTRVNSGGNSDFRRPRAETAPTLSISRQQHNRTMLFLIGRLELCLIGMDKKQALLNKTFSDISHCSQGIKNPDHFGFICRETTVTAVDTYVGYVFRCQTEKVVDEVMKALKQAFHNAHQSIQYQNNPKSQSTICDTCPMHWYHKLCVELEGLSPEEAQLIIIKRTQSLSDNEREEIMLKCQEEDVENEQERNEIFMMLIRKLCEQKQLKHTHLTNGCPNKVDKVPSKLNSFRQKAKKSLHSSFETILKLSPFDVSENTILEDTTTRLPPYREGSYDAPDAVVEENTPQRPRSSTIGTSGDVHKEVRRKISVGRKDKPAEKPSPLKTRTSIRDIFKKVGTPKKSPPSSDNESPETPSKPGSWRQAIFNKVQTPVKHGINVNQKEKDNATGNEDHQDDEVFTTPRSSESLRLLWKKAIMEQILLIRMEKENRKLQMRQNAASSKRMKLDYEEISPCLKDAVLKWEMLLNDPDRAKKRIDWLELQDAVKTGIPRHKRGEIWQFLAEQHFLHLKCTYTIQDNIDLTVQYEDLIKQLTSHQHAILIDLGRTFPNHPYYSQPLGSGQLALFNLLKAYSLLDKEVGYCQGLSFVAGILLLHMPEDRAFSMMKHILFHLGFRKQYKPDMVALQIQMYQLSRLVFDHQKEIYDHFENYDISPTLYAAPWFLTMYASQFPLGFVSRLFDLIFLHGTEAIFKVSLVLLANHKDRLLQCHGFEQIMEFLKISLPSMDIIQMERVFNQVSALDISQKLQAYEVEYQVLQEEMSFSPESREANRAAELEESNRNLKLQNMELTEQLQVAHNTVHILEESVASHQMTTRRLESRVRALEDEREALMHSVNIMRRRLEKLETAQLTSDSPELTDGRPPCLGVINAYTGGEREEEMRFASLMKECPREAFDKLLEEDNDGAERKNTSSGSEASDTNSDVGSSL